jgi:hypothetical protein
MDNITRDRALLASRAQEPRGLKPNADLLARGHLPKNLAFGRPRSIRLRSMQAVANVDRPEQQPTALWTAPYPWGNIYTHAAMEEWVDKQGLNLPIEWPTFTLAEKKEHLASAFGEGK